MARRRRGLLTRLILFLAGFGFLLLFTVFLAGVIWIGPLVRKALEVYGPDALGAQVKVEEVSIGLFGGTAKARGVVVGNPEGFTEPIAMDARQFEIRLRLRSLFSDTVVIEDITIWEPVITYEKRSGITNLAQLQENARAWAESLSDKEKEEPSKKVIIERFRILGGQLRVKLPGLPAVPIQLADIERSNIGGEPGGQNFGHAIRDVIATLQLNAGDAVSNAGDGIEMAARKALDASKGLGTKTLDAGGKALDGAGKAVKGLFGK